MMVIVVLCAVIVPVVLLLMIMMIVILIEVDSFHDRGSVTRRDNDRSLLVFLFICRATWTNPGGFYLARGCFDNARKNYVKTKSSGDTTKDNTSTHKVGDVKDVLQWLCSSSSSSSSSSALGTSWKATASVLLMRGAVDYPCDLSLSITSFG